MPATDLENRGARCGQWIVSGRVQGVGFRWFTQRTAEKLGLLGWVRNLPDGRVEAAAMGAEGALREFESALRRGPKWASVENVEKVDKVVDIDNLKSFHIR